MELNKKTRHLADAYDLGLIGLHQIFGDQNQVPEELVIDGLYLNNAGSQRWGVSKRFRSPSII